MVVKKLTLDGAAGSGGSASATRRARNPQGQGGRLRSELIAAADRLLAETGDVKGLSLRAVARAVGIATPSIYLHFPDKSALLHAVFAARFAELELAVRAAVEQASGPAAQLRAGCLAYCHFAMEHPSAYRVLFGRIPRPATSQPETTVQPSDLTTPGSYAGATAFGFLVSCVETCMRTGEARAGDPFHVATGIWTALHGVVTLRASSPAFPWPPLDRQVDDILAGLAGVHHNPSQPDADVASGAVYSP